LCASVSVALAIICIGVYQGVQNALEDETTGLYSNVNTFYDTVQSFNLAIFSFGVNSVLPTLEYSMETPEDFPMVSNVSFFIITEIYIAVGLCGYAGWGDLVESNVLQSITSSYGIHSFLGVLADIVTVLITIHLCVTFPLPMNPININLESALGIDKLEGRTEWVSRVVVRTLVMSIMVFVAMVVPYFGDVVGFVSALAGIAVAFFLPVLFYFVLNRKLISKAEQVFMISVLVVGVAGTAVGLYVSSVSLIDDIKQNPSPFADFFSNCTSTS